MLNLLFHFPSPNIHAPFILTYMQAIGGAWPTNLGAETFHLPHPFPLPPSSPSPFPLSPALPSFPALPLPHGPHPSLSSFSPLIGGPGFTPENFLAPRLLHVSFGAFSDEINVSLMRRFVGRKYAFAVTHKPNG
jgi:hypothetical protein